MSSTSTEKRVPVTAKLSRQFYERLGDDIASELVDWFNAVDLTYQAQLRELNDLNWERFKVTLHAEIATLRGELLAEIGSLRGDSRTEIGSLRGEWRTEIASSRGEIAEMRGALETKIADLRTEMHAMRNAVLTWTLVYGTTTMIALAGLFFAVLR
ncbi:MAG: coiled-coil domain-containing protein [Gemmatimonadaceae bacterium]